MYIRSLIRFPTEAAVIKGGAWVATSPWVPGSSFHFPDGVLGSMGFFVFCFVFSKKSSLSIFFFLRLLVLSVSHLRNHCPVQCREIMSVLL